MKLSTATRLTEPLVRHGEGPFWDERESRLLFMDMLDGHVVSREADGTILRHPVPGPVAAVIRRRTRGGFAIGLEHGFAMVDETLTRFDPLPPILDDPSVRLNEGACDPRGRFFLGSMAHDETAGAGALYRLELDGSVSVVLPSVTVSNGVQWSADGRRVFYIDSPTGRIDVFDVDAESGEWSGRRPFAAVDGTPGIPDGMAIDEQDGLWVALWKGGGVRHYGADGTLLEHIYVPGCTQVTACAFGGADRSTLYITTSRNGLDPGREPDAGALFVHETEVVGARPHEYAG